MTNYVVLQNTTCVTQ